MGIKEQEEQIWEQKYGQWTLLRRKNEPKGSRLKRLETDSKGNSIQ